MNKNIPELLAPAGSPESLNAAVAYGADAVYLGCNDFANARMNAENFTKETLVDAIDFCHSHNVKTYVTVNTLLSDREMEGLYSYVSFLYQNGADGIIVQEAGVMDFLHRHLPKLPVHASTQAGICNIAGLQAAKQLGCTRAVAARELSMEELAVLCKENIEIEVFVHGALCACYSGFCLMSSMIGRRSGNRGKCAQPCRLPYSIGKEKPSLLMNLKDNLLLPHIDSLARMGVASLKIEGRMKGPEYVGLVTSFYRRALDGETISDSELDRLKQVFDRGGYTDGYYTNQNHMFAYQKPETPYRKQEMPAPIQRKIPIKMEGELKKEQVFRLTVSDASDHHVLALGETPAFPAQNRPLDEQTVSERLGKLGDTPYSLQQCRLALDPGIMIPLGELARVKRQACEELTLLRTQSFKRSLPDLSEQPFVSEGKHYSVLEWTATVNTGEQYLAIAPLPFEWIALPLEVAWKHRKELNQEIVIQLPAVSHQEVREKINQQLSQLRILGFSRLLCGNLGDYYGFPQWEKKGDLTLWLYNSTTGETLSKENPTSLCLSPELNIGQIKQLRCRIPCEAYLYGRLPLMRSKHCFVNSFRGSCKGACQLTDRTGTVFPVRCVNGEHIMYNSAPLYMGDKLSDFHHTCVRYGRLSFTVEQPTECVEIANSMMKGLPFEQNKTRGHYYRGV